jgi:hypothetical protein
MSTAIPEQIATVLVERLETITTDNSYAFSVNDVTRVQRSAKGWTPRNLSLAVEMGAENRSPDIDHEGNPAALGYVQEYLIHGFVRQSDRGTTVDNTTENALVAAIKKAVAGTSDWHTFGDVSIDADWGPKRPFISPEGEHAGQTLSLLVMYRISETDPFEARA